MGHGHLKWAPGPVGSPVALPKVVMTATSDWRTWKTKRSRKKTTSSNAPMTWVTGFCFIRKSSPSWRSRGGIWFRFCHRQRHVENVGAHFFLEVQQQDVLGVGRGQDEFARAAAATGECLQIGPLRVNVGRRMERGHLVGELGGAGQGHGHGALPLR